MEHLALYRKWRPQRFGDLVGQDAISRTLLNAIAQDRLAHAYLFCGPRGTGKTSTARLLAKSLNCSQPQGGEPCNACQSCEEITAGHSLDVIEIDAASNRGIDDARELREQVRFSASGGRYRVFIIDEFHMLTNEAFNALLKTLEEPPANVIFVLATTEPHKILPTIVSRCQRFDFQRIALPALLKHLQKVAAAEQIGVSPQALEAIARKAAGGGRDALSLLDQVHAMSVPGETLPDHLVYQVLGLIDEETLLALARALFQSQIEPLLSHLQSLLEKGHDPLQIIQELLQLLRHLTLSHLPAAHLEPLGVPAHLIPALKELSTSLTPGQSVSVIEQLLKSADRLHKVTQPEIWLEADLIQICLQAERSLLQRLEDLERRVSSASRRPRSHPVHSSMLSADPPVRSERPQPSSSLPVVLPIEDSEIWIPDAEPKEASEAERGFAIEQQASPPTQEPIQVPVSPPIQALSSPSSLPAAIGDLEMSQIWQRFLNRILEQQGPLYGFMNNGKLVHIDTVQAYWIVRFNSRPHKERVEKSLKTGRLDPLLEEIMGRPFELRLEMAGERALSPTPESASVSVLPEDRSLPSPPVKAGGLPPPVRPQTFQAAPSPGGAKSQAEIPPEAEAPPPLPEDSYVASAEPFYEPVYEVLENDVPVERVEPAWPKAPESVPENTPARAQPLETVAELFKGKVIRLDS